MSVRDSFFGQLVLAATVVALGVGFLGAAQGEPEIHGAIALLRAVAYDPGDASETAGWHWMRPGTRQFADWVFGPVQTSQIASGNPYVYINLSALVTNGFSGGCGWETTVRVEVYQIATPLEAVGLAKPGGRSIQTTTRLLENAFQPRLDADTRGVGYETRASALRIAVSTIDRYAPEYGPLLMIRVTRLGGDTGRPEHVAVRSSSVVVAYEIGRP